MEKEVGSLSKIESKEDSQFLSQRFLLKETKLIATFIYQLTKETKRAYEADIKHFFSCFKGKTLKNIESVHLVAYFNIHKDWSLATQMRKRSAISSLYRFLILERYVDHNPVASLKPLKVPDKTSEKIFDHEEIKEMIRKTESKRDKFLIKFLYLTGARIEEACDCKLTHFRKRKNIKLKEEEYFLTIVGKGNKARTFKIPEELTRYFLGTPSL